MDTENNQNLLKDDTFNFFVPLDIAKAGPEDDKDKRWVQGIASTETVDLQDEKVIQSGIDTSYLLKYGYFNESHRSGPEHLLGEPTECRVTPKGLWVKGFLYKNHKAADQWWELLNSLVASKSSRRVGMSIEGKVTRREGKTIRKCWLKAIAITEAPVNYTTYLEIAKALSAEKFCSMPWAEACDCESGTACNVGDHKDSCACKNDKEKALTAGGMGGILVPESLEGGVKVTTHKSLDEFNFQQAIEYLQSEKGYSPNTAKSIADVIFLSHGLR